MAMEVTELSLAATHDECHVVEKSRNSCMSESENNPSRKRKCFSDQLFNSTSSTPAPAAAAIQTSVDLQLKGPLPLDWEQCLDLESGRMYYMNRKTLKKSWNWPENKQKIDLELNISTLSNCSNAYDHDHEYPNKHQYSTSDGSSDDNNNNNMVALACLNCHLLVILSKSSPSCPNCKYVHSFPNLQTQPPNVPPSKSPNTLSLLKY